MEGTRLVGPGRVRARPLDHAGSDGACSVAGERQPAPDGRRTRVADPASGELITDVADETEEDGSRPSAPLSAPGRRGLPHLSPDRELSTAKIIPTVSVGG